MRYLVDTDRKLGRALAQILDAEAVTVERMSEVIQHQEDQREATVFLNAELGEDGWKAPGLRYAYEWRTLCEYRFRGPIILFGFQREDQIKERDYSGILGGRNQRNNTYVDTRCEYIALPESSWPACRNPLTEADRNGLKRSLLDLFYEELSAFRHSAVLKLKGKLNGSSAQVRDLREGHRLAVSGVERNIEGWEDYPAYLQQRFSLPDHQSSIMLKISQEWQKVCSILKNLLQTETLEKNAMKYHFKRIVQHLQSILCEADKLLKEQER